MRSNRLATEILLGVRGLLLIAVCATVSLVASAATAQPRTVDVPELKVGDSWLYKRARGDEFITRVIEVGPLGFVTDSPTHPGAKFYRDLHRTITKIEGTLTEGSPKNLIGWKWLDFPLSPGKKFKYQVEGATAPFSMEVKVVKWEKMSVPAGVFEALRIDGCYFNEASRWYGCGQEWWYAPEVKGFVKRRTPGDWARSLLDSDFDLLKFMPGPQPR